MSAKTIEELAHEMGVLADQVAAIERRADSEDNSWDSVLALTTARLALSRVSRAHAKATFLACTNGVNYLIPETAERVAAYKVLGRAVNARAEIKNGFNGGHYPSFVLEIAETQVHNAMAAVYHLRTLECTAEKARRGESA